MFYAGYEDWQTANEVAVFETEEDRDKWVNGMSFFPRYTYNDFEVSLMDIVTWDKEETDIFGVKWKINSFDE